MPVNLTPGKIRSRLEVILADMRDLERDIQGPIDKGVVGLREVSFEIAESSDGLHRALELLDSNYKKVL